MESDQLKEFAQNVFTELVANLVWVILAAGILYLSYRLRKHLSWFFVGAFRKYVAGLFLLYAALGFGIWLGSLSLFTALAASSIVAPILGAIILFRFRRLGIVDAYPTTEKGINYFSSLKRPRRTFDFLGVGAHKLTTDSEFREMIKRCASAGRPVRLLLSPPNNPVLQSIATRSGSDKRLYEKRVKESLRTLHDLAENSGFNLQVRFYEANSESDFHQFRLVFIDEQYCIMSYTIWDNNEGRSNPQLILKATDKDSASIALYYAFQDYFQRLWDDKNTVEVDLSKYK